MCRQILAVVAEAWSRLRCMLFVMASCRAALHQPHQRGVGIGGRVSTYMYMCMYCNK